MKNRVFDVLGGPGRWIVGDQALEAASGALYKIPQPLIVVGEFFLLESVRVRLIDPLKASGYDLTEHVFPDAGECCLGTVARIEAKAKGAGCLLAVGGGKCLDAVKLAAKKLKLPVVTVPSTPATCACATAVAVLYDEEGVYQDTLELEEAPQLVLMDTIWMAWDTRFMSAGVVDAAAKWLEWQALPSQARDTFGAETGLALARRSWEMVRSKAGDAAACQLNRERLLEAVMLLSAQASCVGAAPAALAHSVCNALSLLAVCRQMLHGELVGLGLRVQDSLLKERGIQLDGAQTREAWLKTLGVPTVLSERLSSENRKKIILKALSAGESSQAMRPVPSPQELERALRCLNPLS